MAVYALIAWALWLAVVLVLRDQIHRRRTGASGLVMEAQRKLGPRARWLGAVQSLTLLLVPAASIAELCGLRPWWDTSTRAAHATALVLFLVSLVGTFACQLAMRDSWRVGVDPESRTELVTRGPYRFVRNPIYTFVILATIASFAATPNALSLTAVVLTSATFELQVRWIEEPHLASVHGEAFRRWAERTGRFVPGVGKLG